MENLASYLGGIAGVIMLGVFVRVVTILSILRFGLGLKGPGTGIAFTMVAFVLSLAVLEIRGPVAVDTAAIFTGKTIFKSPPDEKLLDGFLEKNSDPSLQSKVTQSLSKNTTSPSPLSVKLSIYLLSQLHDAFSAGCLLLVPFVIVDILVAVTFTSVGVVNMSSATLAIPLKLLLFVAVDGWGLLTARLLGA